MLRLFRGICVALEQLHEHKANSAQQPNLEEEPLMEDTEDDVIPYAHRDIKPGTLPNGMC